MCEPSVDGGRRDRITESVSPCIVVVASSHSGCKLHYAGVDNANNIKKQRNQVTKETKCDVIQSDTGAVCNALVKITMLDLIEPAQ